METYIAPGYLVSLSAPSQYSAMIEVSVLLMRRGLTDGEKEDLYGLLLDDEQKAPAA